jgi:hypothetical protein
MAKQNSTQKLNEELAFLRDQITSIGAQIGEAINERLEETGNIVDRVSTTINKTTAKAAVKSVTDLTKGLDSALQNQLKLNQGALKLSDVTRAQQGLETRRLTLKQNLQNLENLGLITAKERAKQEQELAEALNNEAKILNQQAKEYDTINQKLGVTGKLINGISKIPVLGNLIDAEEALGTAQLEAAKKGSTSATVMKKAFSSLGSSLKSNLMDPLTGITLVLTGVKQLYNIFKKVDTETGNFAKEMGISYNEARSTRKEFEQIAANSGDVNITASKLLQSQLEINKALGANAKVSEDDLKTYTQLRDVAGVEPEILNESLKLSKLRNVSLRQSTASLLGQLKLTKSQLGINFSNKEIMEEVAKTSNVTKISLGGSTEALVKGVAQAKALGTSLGKLDNIAGSLLNFEESISAELEAELLTGKDLNLEGARRAALNNDLVGLGRELKAQGVDAVKFGKMNRLQQESIAKAMGMSREEMADMLMEQQALQALGKQNMDQVKEEYEIARKQGKEAEFLAKLGNKELGDQLQRQSVQERIAAAQEKLVSAFEKLSPIIEAIVTPIADFAGFLTSSKPLMDAIVKGALLLAGIKFANFLGLGKSLGGIGGAVGGGGAAGATKALSEKQIAAGFGGKAAKEALKTGGMEAAQTAMKGGGGLFGKIGSFFGKMNPLNFVKGKIGKVAGKLLKFPIVSSVLETMFAGQDIANLISGGGSLNEIYSGIGKRGGEAIGGIGGAALGAVVGSLIPGPGTLIGGILGDTLGRWVGGALTESLGAEGFGKTIASTFGYDKDIEEKIKGGTINAKEEGIKGGTINAKDYVIKTLPEDTVVGAGGTKLGRTDEMVSLLQELISAVKTGGNVYLDGNKVGTAMAMGTFKTQ